MENTCFLTRSCTRTHAILQCLFLSTYSARTTSVHSLRYPVACPPCRGDDATSFSGVCVCVCEMGRWEAKRVTHQPPAEVDYPLTCMYADCVTGITATPSWVNWPARGQRVHLLM